MPETAHDLDVTKAEKGKENRKKYWTFYAKALPKSMSAKATVLEKEEKTWTARVTNQAITCPDNFQGPKDLQQNKR